MLHLNEWGSAAVTGVGTSSTNTFIKDLPLFIAFVLLAIFTFVSGLRAPALIAFIKDTLIYLMVIVAVFYIPTRLGGWGHIFGTAQTHFAAINPATKKPFGAIADKTTAANVKQAGGNAQLAVPTCSSRCSRAGSPGSRSRASSSARWRPPRSWPSPRRTCSPATRDPGFPVGLAEGKRGRIGGREPVPQRRPPDADLPLRQLAGQVPPGADETLRQEYTADPAKPPSPLRLVLFMIKLLTILIR
jgi:hypothetical protein